jgi:hypothetical protein
MTTLELKTQIQKELDKVPEKVLPEILGYIHSRQQPLTDKEKLNQFIEKVFKEDDGLLRRLAQ